MEEILFWNNGLFRQPYWYSFLYSKLMQDKYRYDAVDNSLGITNATSPQGLTKLNKAQQSEVGRDKYAQLPTPIRFKKLMKERFLNRIGVIRF